MRSKVASSKVATGKETYLVVVLLIRVKEDGLREAVKSLDKGIDGDSCTTAWGRVSVHHVLPSPIKEAPVEVLS